jgi:hypothetical protein
MGSIEYEGPDGPREITEVVPMYNEDIECWMVAPGPDYTPVYIPNHRIITVETDKDGKEVLVD